MSSSLFQSSDVASWWLDDDDQDNDEPFKAEENERDCTIFVIDCNDTMFSETIDNKPIFNNVCSAIENTLKRKIIKSRDDLVCFILFNVLETQNAMKLSNIYLLNEPDSPSAKLIKQMRDLPLTFNNNFKSLSLNDNKECDFRDLLWILQNILSEIDVKGTKYGSKRSFIFTNNDKPKYKDLNATIAKAQDMMDNGMEINVFPLSDNFQIKQFYGNVCTFNLDELSTESQFHSYCPTLSDLENDLRVKEMKKRSIASCPLTIGTNFKMAVKIYSLYRRSTKESPQWLDARTNQPLTTETRWICCDTGQILDDSSIKTYHEYGPSKERIYFTKQEMNDIKTFGSPSLTLMGFKPLNRLKPYYQYKASQFLYPDESRCNGSILAFNALLTAMIELNEFAICRYIFRKISGPRFVALIGQKEIIDESTGNQLQAPGINMIYLPFADDIRKIDIDNQENMKRCIDDDDDDDNDNDNKHEILIECASKIIDKLSLEELHQPSNPVLQRHYDALEALALEQLDGNNNDDNKEEIDDTFIDEIKPPNNGMLQAADKEINQYLQILNEFGGKLEIEEKENKKKRKADDNNNGIKKKKAQKRKRNDTASSASEYEWENLVKNDELKSLKVKDLKIYLSENGLKMSGKKADLIERIKNNINKS